MLGAIAGDIIGAPYERWPIKHTDFQLFTADSRFTDDSVMTVATAAVLLGGEVGYAESYQRFGREYPRAGYGETFFRWLHGTDPKPYGSWGNGSAMRVSPVGWARDSMESVLAEAEASAVVTHDHPEGIKGAQATALAVFRARTGVSKEAIREEIGQRFGYDLTRTAETIRPTYRFDVSCQGTVPEALICFLESKDYEDCIRLAISLGGDSDTLAAIAGSIAEAFYGGVPFYIAMQAQVRLPPELKAIVERFYAAYKLPLP